MPAIPTIEAPPRLPLVLNGHMLVGRGASVVALKRTHCGEGTGTRGVLLHMVRSRVFAVAWDHHGGSVISPAQQHTLGVELDCRTSRAHLAWWARAAVTHRSQLNHEEGVLLTMCAHGDSLKPNYDDNIATLRALVVRLAETL
jgi:hypothetical protein